MNTKHNEALKAYKQQDYQKAFALWSNEATNQNDQAMANLGIMYLKGEGLAKDFLKAKEWFEKAIEYENDSAYYNLALMYQSSIGVDEDMPKALEFFEKAAQKGHTLASFRLGVMLLKERHDKEKVKKGFEAMLFAAKTGHTMAKMQFGGLERQIPQDFTQNFTYRKLSFDEQLAVLEDALERYIRPTLLKDGGNLLLIEYKCEPEIEIRLAYQGNCAGCSLASTTTYTMILDVLSKVIDEGINLYII